MCEKNIINDNNKITPSTYTWLFQTLRFFSDHPLSGKILLLHEIQLSKNILSVVLFVLQALKSLLLCMAKDWAAAEMKTKRETMVNIARITRKTTIRCSMMCQLVFICYVSLRLLSMKYDDNKLFVRGYYPYDVTISPNYELTMIGQVIAGIYGAVTFPAVDTFIAMLVLHACGQLSNLKNDLRMIHSYDKKDVRTKLKKIVQKHNYINRFVLKRNYQQPVNWEDFSLRWSERSTTVEIVQNVDYIDCIDNGSCWRS